MIDDDLSTTFFLESGSEQLRKIHEWARSRQTARWALFGSVLLRVAASTPYTVQLPPIIGDYVSLNAFGAFVSASGGGKGKGDAVGRRAWPADIAVVKPGSGEGIAEMFTDRKDKPRLNAAIITANEIDALTGLASRQGSILMAELKSAWMGEPLGQRNAGVATSRHVAEHHYRLCLSVGAQFGHAGMIFADTSGGSPQRFWWFLTTDPNMPLGTGIDPDPLDTTTPEWQPNADGVVEIIYDHPEIAETIRAADLARNRGEGDALDGHAVLSRCKVAALLAIMHQRQNVTRWDWELSEIVMKVSDTARDAMVEHDRQAARAKLRERAIGRAVFDEIIDDRHGATVRNRILRLLANGPMARGELRRAMGKQHYREAFDAVLPHLEKIRHVVTVPGEKAMHYAINPEFTGEPEFTPESASSDGVNRQFTGEPSNNVTNLDSRRSGDSSATKPSCQKWFNNHIARLVADGETTASSFAVYAAGQAEGYTRQQLRTAASSHPDVTVIDRTGGKATWDITGSQQAPYRSALEWVNHYLDQLPAGTEIDKDRFRLAGVAAGHSWTATRRGATESGRIESVRGDGLETVWVLKPSEETA